MEDFLQVATIPSRPPSPSPVSIQLLEDLQLEVQVATNPSCPPSPSPVSIQQPSNLKQPCYTWENNSCWLDASLQLLFVALSRNFSEFSSLVQTVQPGHPLRTLHSMFEQRLNLRQDVPNCTVTQILKRQRNDLRQQLIEHRQASDPTSLEPLMVRRDALW
jgi:hypothetical protein